MSHLLHAPRGLRVVWSMSVDHARFLAIVLGSLYLAALIAGLLGAGAVEVIPGQ